MSRTPVSLPSDLVRQRPDILAAEATAHAASANIGVATAALLLAEDEALSTAAEALHLVQANYEAAIATYLDVLNADMQYRQAKICDLQAIAVRYQDTVALFTALGGGWWNAQDPHGGAGESNGKSWPSRRTAPCLLHSRSKRIRQFHSGFRE